MKDPWSVTAEELRAWAADPDATCPQDWEIEVARNDLADEVLRLAAESAGPNRGFFLRVLYLLVGDGVRSKWVLHGKSCVESLLDQASRIADQSIQLWAWRTRDLMAHPEHFDYEGWCRGDLARDHGREQACDFCGRLGREAVRLVDGEDVSICSNCVASAQAIVNRAHGLVVPGSLLAQVDAATNRCSFCRGQGDQRGQLVAVGAGSICSWCLGLCRDILGDARA